MEPDSSNIAFLSGMIAVPGVSALICAAAGKTGRQDRYGAYPDGHADFCRGALFCDVVRHLTASSSACCDSCSACRWRILPAVQTLLVKYSSDQVTGRIFGYNQSFMYLGNVAGPLIGASVSAMAGFRWVFAATAIVVLINIIQLAIALRRRRQLEQAEQRVNHLP